MFCPNCAKENSIKQKFCRACGLNLEQTAESLAAQIPSDEAAKLLKRNKQMERLGAYFLNGFVTIGLGFIFYLIVYRYMFLYGNYLAGIGALALIILGIAGLYLSNYSAETKSNPNFSETNELENETASKLLNESSFQPIMSVTENTTELLKVKPKRITGDL